MFWFKFMRSRIITRQRSSENASRLTNKAYNYFSVIVTRYDAHCDTGIQRYGKFKLNNKRIALATKADRTAYDVRYSCRTEHLKMVLLGRPLQKILRLRHFKSDPDEIWHKILRLNTHQSRIFDLIS